MSERFHFLNYKQRPAVDHLVHTDPALLEYHQQCIATPLRHQSGSRFTGCIHDSDGRIVQLSQRPSSGAAHQPVDPQQIDPRNDIAAQPGRTIYLGNMFHHFGHFILESLSRMWAVTKLGASFDAYYFHNWDGLTDDQLLNREMVITCLNALSIPPERVRLVPQGGVRLSDCLIPQQLFEVNRHVSALFGTVLTDITRNLKSVRPYDEAGTGERIYLSRLHQARRAENEAAIEAIFRNFGFLIIAPERLSFREQIALVSGATIVAGCGGSNMHLAAFARRATVISLDHRLIRNQFILEALREHVAYHVWARREQISPTRWIADEAVIVAALELALAQAIAWH